MHEVQGLTALAQGIIPADERDGGAAAVDAGSRLAARMNATRADTLYVQGLQDAERHADELFGRPLATLTCHEIAPVLERLQSTSPRFLRQLRTDVAALYLGHPEVSVRIGFPGPSLAAGGYPDFDQPQGAGRPPPGERQR